MISRFFILLVLNCFCIAAATQAQQFEMAATQEVRERNGLPNFYQKVNKGKAVKIAYFGGSITEARDGWCEQSLNWLQTQYPKTKFTHINAAIGGTGSDLGAYRLQQDVLTHKPDLIFVEFAVNDAGKSPAVIYKSIEGIVRQIWQQNPYTDICFVYTLTGDMAATLQAGKFPVSASAMEKIAAHYSIPSVHLGLEVVALAKSGKLLFKGKPAEHPDKIVFSGDNVHPYINTGHKLYTEALARALPQISKVAARKQKHLLPAPFVANNWANAKMYSVKDLPKTAGWQEISPETDTVARQLQNRFPYLIKSAKPGEKITIKFKGTSFGLYDVMGPGCGQYRISVDGKPSYFQPRFDQFCTYYRSNYFFLPEMEDKEHVIELEVSDVPLDKDSILAKRNNNSTKTNPEKYRENACYASQIMIIGQLLK